MKFSLDSFFKLKSGTYFPWAHLSACLLIAPVPMRQTPPTWCAPAE
jgi:hypothetical protein